MTSPSSSIDIVVNETVIVSQDTSFIFISDTNDTATVIINGTSFTIKDEGDSFAWDSDSATGKISFTTIGESATRNVENVIFKITYDGPGSHLFSIAFIQYISEDNFIFVYRLNDADSLALAIYYASKYDMSTSLGDVSGNSGNIGGTDWEVRGQLLGVGCSDTEILSSEDEFNTEVLTPIEDALSNSTDLLGRTIWGIILGLNIPGGFRSGGVDIISSTSRISRINQIFSGKTKNKLYNKAIFKRFDSNDADDALICSRIDAPTLRLAKQYIDNAQVLNRQLTVNGTIYIDPYSDRAGPTADSYRDSILEFYNNLATTFNLDIWSTSFIDPYIDAAIPYVTDDSFVWSWFTNRGDDSFFQNSNTIRVFFYNADHDGAYTVRNMNVKTWSLLSLNNGYIGNAGSMSDPTNEGFLNPTAFFRALKNGSTMGEAYLFSLPFLDWTTTLFGDPLVTVEFPIIQEEDEATIEENESWDRMSKELARTAAHLKKKDLELFNVLTDVVDLTSNNKSTELAVLNSANSLHEQNNEIQRLSELTSVTERLFMYPQKRFNGIESVNEYLTQQEFKVSRLLRNITGGGVITDDNLLDEGWWRFEFLVADDDNNFVSYRFKLNVYTDSTYATLAIPYEIDSSSITNWTYERDRDVFVPIVPGGVSSSHIGRRIRYESRLDALIGVNEYLTSGETYYFAITQYNVETGEVYTARQYSDIIYT